MKTKLSIMMIVLFTMCLSVNAQHIRRIQKARVVNGVRQGQVTRYEAAVIHEERKEIREEVKDAKANGVATPAERIRIRQERIEANRAIIRAKNNKRVRS